MRNSMTKAAATGMSLLLGASLLAGCAKSSNEGAANKGAAANRPDQTETAAGVNRTGYPVVKDKLELKMMGSKAAIQGPWEQLHVFTEYEKISNIHVTWDTPPEQNYEEKKNLTFASGDYPDAFFGGYLSTQDELNYGKQGVLLPLEKLIDEYAPAFRSILEANPDLRKAITAPDGHIYSLPNINMVERDHTTKIWINQQWLDKTGLKMPATTDEFYTVLKAFKEKDPNGNGKPDEIPLSSLNLKDIQKGLLGAFGYVGTNNINVIDDKAVYVPVQDGYKEFPTYMKKLYSEGLLDQETFTQTVQQRAAKGKNLQLGAYEAAGAFLVVPVEDDSSYVAMPPLISHVNDQLIWPKVPAIMRGAFAITNKNPNPEATMRWVDYFYSEEGVMLLAAGVEGQDWEWVDKSQKQWKPIVPEGMNNQEYKGGQVTPSSGTAVPIINVAYHGYNQINPLNSRIDEEVAAKYTKHWKEAFPLTYFSEEQQKRVTVLEADMNTYVDQMEAKFIMGAEPLSNWDKYVDTLNKMGADELTKLYQDVYDQWKTMK